MTHELTEAERAFDQFIASRREQGRSTYGQGLDHRDARWSWERMALEELADACQYLVAEVERLRDTLDQERAEREDANAEVERLRGLLTKTCPCGGDGCTSVEDVLRHQCGGPPEACGVPGCLECGRARALLYTARVRADNAERRERARVAEREEARAEVARLRGLLAEARERVGYCPCGSESCASAEAVVARIDAALAPRTPEGGC